MKKVFLRFPDGRKYLIGFTINLSNFISIHYSEYIRESSKTIFCPNQISFYHTKLKETVTLHAVEITENEICFYKAV